MKKKILIIGAGIAGLSAGVYARMNGFDVEIFESHSIPGGLCTAWKRRGYTFDGCIHWLTGSAPGDAFYYLWQELGAFKDTTIINHDEFARFSFKEGSDVVYYTNMDKLEKHLTALSPEDTKQVKKFTSLVKKFAKFNMPMGKPFSMMNPLEIGSLILKMIPYGRAMKFMDGISIRDFARGFQHPHIRDGFSQLLYDDSMSLSAVVFTFAGLHRQTSGYPIGGSLKFAKSIETKLLSLGGTIRYNTRVEQILIKEGRATGVQLAGGETVNGDYVISAGDLYSAMEKLLDGKLAGSPYEKLFKKEKVFPSAVQVSLGVDMDFSDQQDYVSRGIELEQPLQIGGQTVKNLFFKHFSFDPTLSPKGKNVVEVLYLLDDFDYWKNLSLDRPAYKAEKQRILAETLSALEVHFPGITERVEESDVATPVTYQRFAGTWKGAFMTWQPTPENSSYIRMIPNQLPDISNVYFSGMWLMPPGGLPTGVKTSRDVIQQICNSEKRMFTISD